MCRNAIRNLIKTHLVASLQTPLMSGHRAIHLDVYFHVGLFL